MGCISSKQARFDHSPSYESHRHRNHRHYHRHHSSKKSSRDNGNVGPTILDHPPPPPSLINGGFGPLEKIKEEPETEVEEETATLPQIIDSINTKASKKPNNNNNNSNNNDNDKRSTFSIKIGRLSEEEQEAAGWPAWLSAVAGEAIEGWLPLRSDAFERLDKIGQGTYSSVYRARDLRTGKMVALKKVRFENFQPESVRFMAREITILRKLDHPNVIKLEGIITSRFSSSIYLVFEYMEHDLSGLLSCPDIKFSESQIKCLMQQMLCGLEHCHSRGVMHRDIKSANILVNNEGILKIADFGLAYYTTLRRKQPLTSRVVTLWYRPPELLLGSTNYGSTIDLWSVGCVFSELFIGRPLLKGRTEVEQLHKIFKLCGSPLDDYWKTSKLPLATMFKPQNPYESTLRERFKELPKLAVDLIETFLSIEPSDRGSASAALESEYFTTKPYACDPSTLPKYPPNKDIDAKYREDVRRKKASGTSYVSGASKNSRRSSKVLQESSSFNKILPTEEMDPGRKVSRRTGYSKGRGTMSMKAPMDTVSVTSHMTDESQAESTVSVPAQLMTSNGYAWVKRQQQDSKSSKLYGRSPQLVEKIEQSMDMGLRDNDDFTSRDGPNQILKRVMHTRTSRRHAPESFDSSDLFHSQDSSSRDNTDQQRMVHSGPLLSQSGTKEGRKESEARQAVRRSRFYRDL